MHKERERGKKRIFQILSYEFATLLEVFYFSQDWFHHFQWRPQYQKSCSVMKIEKDAT